MIDLQKEITNHDTIEEATSQCDKARLSAVSKNKLNNSLLIFKSETDLPNLLK